MSSNTIMILLDVAAGIIFLKRAFPALVRMSSRTCHCYRIIYWALAVGAVAMIFSPVMDIDWRRYSHVAVLCALACLALIDRRPAGRLAGPPT